MIAFDEAIELGVVAALTAADVNGSEVALVILPRCGPGMRRGCAPIITFNDQT